MADHSWTRPGAEKWWIGNSDTDPLDGEGSMNIETGIEEYQEKAVAQDIGGGPEFTDEALAQRDEEYAAQPSPVSELSELEEAEEILRFVLNLRMYGESETETWKEAERRIENFLRRDHCTQCGMRFSHRACGPTHAMIWNEMERRTDAKRAAEILTAAYESEEERNMRISRAVREEFYPGSSGNPTEAGK